MQLIAEPARLKRIAEAAARLDHGDLPMCYQWNIIVVDLETPAVELFVKLSQAIMETYYAEQPNTVLPIMVAFADLPKMKECQRTALRTLASRSLFTAVLSKNLEDDPAAALQGLLSEIVPGNSRTWSFSATLGDTSSPPDSPPGESSMAPNPSVFAPLSSTQHPEDDIHPPPRRLAASKTDPKGKARSPQEDKAPGEHRYVNPEDGDPGKHVTAMWTYFMKGEAGVIKPISFDSHVHYVTETTQGMEWSDRWIKEKFEKPPETAFVWLHLPANNTEWVWVRLGRSKVEQF